MSSISLDINYLYAHNTQSNYKITTETIAQTKPVILDAIQQVQAQISQKAYGFINTLEDHAPEQIADQVFQQISSNFKTLVVIGIGGSDLGGRALQQAFAHSPSQPMRLIFHGDSTDPYAITQLLEQIDLSETVFNIISKSGETIETISQYLLLKNFVQKATTHWHKHFIFTTDPHQGILQKEAARTGIATIPLPSDVGGRFSVLTTVGTLPARALGLNPKSMRAAALQFVHDPQGQKVAQEIAAAQYQLYTQGTKVAVLTPYSIQLEEFARWYRQLWAESLGKDGQGILPIQARGPADQHSQYQFYNQGSPLCSYWHLQIEERPQDYLIEKTDIPEAQYLVGHTLHEIINIEQHASKLSLHKYDRPVASLHLQQLTPETIAELFMLFELAVLYLGTMLKVNVFDQPGVEEGKQFMYALLQKPGYEQKLAEIQNLSKEDAP
jgi:glucose-6-phosphate isomerase